MIMKMVEVTKADIKNGHQFSCCLCPIALAVGRTMGVARRDNNGNILVNNHAVYIYPKEIGKNSIRNCLRAKLPDVAKEFIVNFDNGEEVSPISFELELEEKEVRA